MTAMFSSPPKPPTVDYAAQAAAQQAAREAEQDAQLAADRAVAVSAADNARDAETARLKRVKGQMGGAPTGTGQLGSGAAVDVATLGTKLG